MKIAIAADHAGYEEKEQLKPLLDELRINYADLGTGSTESVDYPDYARKVAERVARGEVDQGVLLCGSVKGMAIVAGKGAGAGAEGGGGLERRDCAARARTQRRKHPDHAGPVQAA